MFQPTNRFTLIDSLRPPSGFEFDAAMASTFTLDLRALLAAPAALALQRAVAGEPDSQLVPVDILHAIRQHANKITVFSQAGEVSVPPPGRVFGFLEGSVVPVLAPRGGVVHPKVWVVRFRSAEDNLVTRLRVLVASRNLTFDASWDTVIRLDEAVGEGADLGGLTELFAGLSNCAKGDLLAVHVERVDELCRDLDERQFELPAGVSDLAIHVLGLQAKPSPLPRLYDRSLIISPFVSNDFFSRIHPHRIDTLVSRPEELATLSPSLAINDLCWFDDGTGVDDSDTPVGPAQRLQGLHAKVFGFESSALSRWFIGSANATGAAFTSNVEVLVELSGPTSVLGIDRVCGGNGEEPGIWRLFRPFIPDPDTPEALPDTAGLDGIRQTIATLKLSGVVEDTAQGWSVSYSSQTAIDLPGDVTVDLWPVTTPGSRRRVASGSYLEEVFLTTLDSVTGFLAFEIADGDFTTAFCLPVPLSGLPDDRESHLMRKLIGSADRFLAYLVALLDGGGSDDALNDMATASWTSAA